MKIKKGAKNTPITIGRIGEVYSGIAFKEWQYFPIIDSSKFPNMQAVGNIIKRELTIENKSASIILILEGKEFEAMLDTGALYGCVRSDMLLLLKNKPITGKQAVIHPVSRDVIEKDVYTLSFKIKNIEGNYSEKFLFTEMSIYPLILGTEFLSRCKSFNYYGSENRFELII